MMEEQFAYKNIPGWGIDANPKNDPAYPMRQRHKANNGDNDTGNRPAQQQTNVQLLKSNERPEPSAVIGDTVPPSGLSGVLRRYAFRHSESEQLHWLTLLLADRINVWEGLLDDLQKGIYPKILCEKGWNAEWKYNRPATIRKMAFITVGAGLLLWLGSKRKR